MKIVRGEKALKIFNELGKDDIYQIDFDNSFKKVLKELAKR